MLVMGTFDGVHRGHQALIDLCRARAGKIGAEPWALTFDPHPSTILGPSLAPPLLCTTERRLELLCKEGVLATVLLPFDETLASTSCEEFVERYLLPCGAREIVVGYDFTFGRGRVGDVSTLEDLGRRFGIAVHVVPPVSIEGGIVPSSTKVRQLLLEGRVEAAATLLGRPHDVGGRVVPGEGRGRTIGFPTANVDVESPVLLPANGVYVVRVALGDDEGTSSSLVKAKEESDGGSEDGSWWAGAANIGTNPTFTSSSRVLLEIHLIEPLSSPSSEAKHMGMAGPGRALGKRGYEGPSLVGKKVFVQFVKRLRKEKRFASADHLVQQIKDDVEQARRVLLEDGDAEGLLDA